MTQPEPNWDELIMELKSALLSVNRLSVKQIITRPVEGSTPLMMVEKVVVPALAQIGQGWEDGQLALSQVYMAGRLCEEAVDLIMPAVHATRIRQPKIAIAALEDYHLLGKRIVYSSLRASGIELLNFDRLDIDQLIDMVTREQIEILLLSVLMLPSAIKVREVRDRLSRLGWSGKIVVGGAPFRFDRDLWREVGADACGDSAGDAIRIVHSLITEEAPWK